MVRGVAYVTFLLSHLNGPHRDTKAHIRNQDVGLGVKPMQFDCRQNVKTRKFIED